MILQHHFTILTALAAAGALACNSASSSTSTQPVNFRLAAAAANPPTAPTSAGSPVEITSLRLVVGQAALGNGDQFGCNNCQGNDNETEPSPQLIVVPSDGSPVSVATEQVAAGHYTAAEIELAQPDAAALSRDPAWPAGATVEVAGTANGAPFTVHFALEGQFRETLNPPVDVTDAPTPVEITITLPVSSWFTLNGATLDPNDPAQLTQIEQNARASLEPAESGKDRGTEQES